MHVELIYSPGCGTYRKAQDALETVIAEERLPLPVYLKVSNEAVPPLVIVDGEPLKHCFQSHGLENLRDHLSQRWHALTAV